MIRYPIGKPTPHALYAIRKGDLPNVSLTSPNEQISIDLMGGLSMADKIANPESVQVKSIRGLIAPWETIDQQGATEDGVSFIDALYGATEIDVDVDLFARDAKHLRQLRRHLFESLDVKQQSELCWETPELGCWWAPVRLWKKPDNPENNPNQAQQALTLRLRGDSGFWQSWPDIDTFALEYADMTETFTLNRTAERDLGPNWPMRYDGDGGGYLYSNGDHARWRDDPDDPWTTRSRSVVCGPYKDFATAGSNQIASMVLGSFPEWSVPETGANDLWARMGRNLDGSWNGNGIRLRCTTNIVHLSAWVDYEVVWQRSQRMGLEILPGIWIGGIPPFPGDKWQLAAGFDDESGGPRMFKVYRNGSTILTHKEVGTQSVMNASHRGIGFGVRAAGALITQATPAIVRKISAGDNTLAAQTGFLKRHNAGDQDAYDEYTVYGPATKVEIANGPGSTELVEIRDLKAGEIMHIRTDPRRGGVFDYTPRTGNETAPMLWNAKVTDQMYKKLRGRFTNDCMIPAKQPGMRVAEHLVKVSITGGNADTMVMAQLTPLRRYPQ
ncbi:MAG: phage tail domain-containing protein [Mycobacterium sp.]